MPSVAFGAPKKVAKKAKQAEQQIIHPALRPITTEPALEPRDRVLIAIQMIARLIETRRNLAQAIKAVDQIDAEALEDPANANHPQFEQVRAAYEERCARERQLWIQAIEIGNEIGRLWEHLTPDERRRSGLATILDVDPDDVRIMFDLWEMNTTIDRIAPLPEPWAIPSDLAHMVGHDPGVQTYEAADLMRAAVTN